MRETDLEGLLELVVGASRDFVILKVLPAVEVDRLGLDLAVLDVNLKRDEHQKTRWVSAKKFKNASNSTANWLTTV